MKKAIYNLLMHDPITHEEWFKPHVTYYESDAELQAKVAILKAGYTPWNGEKPDE